MAALTASLVNPAVGLNGNLPIVEIQEVAGNEENLPGKREEKPPDGGAIKDGGAKDGDAEAGGTDAKKSQSIKEIK